MRKLRTTPVLHAVSTALHPPPLETGDHLDQATFHARYEAMPEDFRAEWIGGVVFVPSPLRKEHGQHHALVMGWLTNYWVATPGTETLDHATAILGASSEPQPDAALLIDPACGGRTGLTADGYVTGPPELIVEVASSSESIDLHAKRRDYEQAGVLEYAVILLRQRAVRWFVLQGGAYREANANEDGIFRSAVFPGLWLHAPALLRLDGQRVMDTLRQGLETPAHAAFVQQLEQQRLTP